MKVIIVEDFREETTPEIEYYAFDWDDNIMVMPTQIILLDDNQNEVGMSTEDFAEYRSKIGIEPFEYKGKMIQGFAKDPFRYFSTKGDKRFIIDSLLGKTGPAWDDFVNAINNGSIFSIVTARGHSPLVIRQAIENMIELNFKGISKKELSKNLRKFRDIAGEDEMSDEQLIDAYMDMNKYYPVTFGEGSAQSPEKGKLVALKEFEGYIKYISDHLHKQGFLKNKISNRFIPKIYFSDDDKKNLEFTHKKLADRPENIIQFVSTHGGEKKKYEG
jgi:hypothetical protein